MIATCYLLIAAWGAVSTWVASTAGRRPPQLGPLYWIIAWPVAELPLQHVAASAAVTALAAGFGAFATWQGWAGAVLVAASWPLLVRLDRLGRESQWPLRAALVAAFGEHAACVGDRSGESVLPRGYRLRPFRVHDREGVERLRNLSYGPAGVRNQLDLYRPRGVSLGHAPVLLQIHGGAWVFGDKDHQGLPLMNALARRGFVCVAINYRLSPSATFPDHLVDCKRALAWIRGNIAGYGGDPDWVAVTGGSAGGHLAALLALTPNEPALQPGFEQADTRVSACVPMYGAYDFLRHNGVDVLAARGRSFVETQVMKSSPREAREAWERASPIHWVNREAPPFFVIHGAHDSLVWCEGARDFVAALRAVSASPVAYAELPGAQHAFDLFWSPRCGHAVEAIASFLEHARAAAPRAARLGAPQGIDQVTPTSA
jgi:acetyl esterase/lipase